MLFYGTLCFTSIFEQCSKKATKQTMKKMYIYAYKAFVCQRQKKNARCVKKYLFLLRIQISYKKGKSNKHIGIYLNAVHKNHQHIYVHIWEKIYPDKFYSMIFIS